MATVQIFHEEDGSTSTVTVSLQNGLLSDSLMENESYLTISTSIRKVDGTVFPTYVIRDLTDVAPGASSPAVNFTTLVNGYIEYFVSQAEFGQSSSSSSSSDGNSESSSSSSDGNSESSSSSDGNSESSSSS